MEQGGLAAAALSGDSGKTALFKGQGDVVHGVDGGAAAPVGFAKISAT
jgi:hypothetical protein